MSLTTSTAGEDGRTLPMIVWGLYLAALLTAVPFVIGVIVAYVARSGSIGLSRAHYTSQIWTFWIGLLWFVAGWVLVFAVIGWIILAVLWLWMFVRCLSGLIRASRGQMPPGF